MSLRQALKRSLEEGGTAVPAAATKAHAAPEPAAPAAKRARKAVPKKPARAQAAARARAEAAPAMPRMELQEDRDEEAEDEPADDDGGDSDADRASLGEDDGAGGGATEGAAAAIAPLKKRFAAAAAAADDEQLPPKARAKATAAAAEAAAAAAATAATALDDDSDGDGGAFGDGFDADFMGDAHDRARLMAMNEVEREGELAKRAEARSLLQMNIKLKQQLAGRGKAGAAAAAAAARPAAARGRARAAARPTVAKAAAAAKPAAAAAAAADSSSSSSSSSSSGDSSSSESTDADSTGSSAASSGRGGAKAAAGSAPRGRLRARAARRTADDSSDDEEISAAVRPPRGKAKPKPTTKAQREKAERDYKQFGSEDDEDSADDDEDDDESGGGGAAGGRRGGDAFEDSESSDDFDDGSDGGGADVTRIVSADGGAAGGLTSASSGADLRTDVTVDKLSELLLLRHAAAVKFLAMPNFNDIVVGSFVRFPRPTDPRRRDALEYRIARVVGTQNVPPYSPWRTEASAREHARDDADSFIEKTNKVLLVAIGSENTCTTQAKDGRPVTMERMVRISELSDHSVLPREFEEYKLRVKQRYEARGGGGGDPRDRLPTLAEAERVHKRSADARARAHFDADAVNKRLAAADMLLDSKLATIPNLTHVRDMATLKLADATAKAASAEPGSKEARHFRNEVARFTRRLALVAEEEARRRAALLAAETNRQKKGKDVSSLTRIINVKVEAANRRTMEEISEELRGRSAADVDADTDDNPYARRRTVPKNLWTVSSGAAGGDAAAAAAAAPAAGAAAAAGDGSGGEVPPPPAASASASDGGTIASSADGGRDAAAPALPATAAGGDSAVGTASFGEGTGDAPAPAGGRKSISLADFRKRLAGATVG